MKFSELETAEKIMLAVVIAIMFAIAGLLFLMALGEPLV